MSIASEVNAYRPIGVLLGGPFAPQRSIEPTPVICALLRAPKRLGRSRRSDALDWSRFRRYALNGRSS